MHRFTSSIKVEKLPISYLEKKLMYFQYKKFAKSFQHTGALNVGAL